jgi:glycosyltransferase involved in cell wall biosynthesis
VVSIITINYNNQKGLKKTIESVVTQTSTQVEFIVIDGGSNDGSKAVLESFSNQITYWESEKDKGIYHAMNKGISKARGEYLLFLNSGDYLIEKDTIKNIESDLHSHNVISGDIILEEKDKKTYHRQSKDKIDLSFFLEISLYHQATFISKKMFDTYGLYDETFKLGGDYEFFIRLFYKYNATYKHIAKTISYFVVDGISNNLDYAKINSEEHHKSWALNVSERTLEIFKEHESLKKSNAYWMVLKDKRSKPYYSIFKLIHLIRIKLYRFFKRNQ